MKNTFSKFEAISVIAVITITQIVLNMPEYLVDLTGTGTIVNILYIAVIGYVLCFIIFKFFKNFPNLDILDLAESIGRKNSKIFISYIFYIIFYNFSSCSNFKFHISYKKLVF